MSVRKRRHFSLQEKTELVRLSYLPGNSVCGVARAHGVNPVMLFRWRAQDKKGGLKLFCEEEQTPDLVAKYAAAIDEIKRLKKQLQQANADNELLRDAVELMKSKKSIAR